MLSRWPFPLLTLYLSVDNLIYTHNFNHHLKAEDPEIYLYSWELSLNYGGIYPTVDFICLPTSLKCIVHSIHQKPKSDLLLTDCFLSWWLQLTSFKLRKPKIWIHPWDLPFFQASHCHIWPITKLCWFISWIRSEIHSSFCIFPTNSVIQDTTITSLAYQKASNLVYPSSLWPPPIQLPILSRCFHIAPPP